MVKQITLRNYRKEEDLYFAFSRYEVIKGEESEGGKTTNIQSIELNPTVTDATFKIPEE